MVLFISIILFVNFKPHFATEMPEANRLEKLQEKIHDGFSNLFGWWGDLVARRTCCVFAISCIVWTIVCKSFLLLNLFLGAGYANMQTYEDETLIWSPTGNDSIVALDRSKELFSGSAIIHFITMIVTAKETTLETSLSDAKNILTL